MSAKKLIQVFKRFILSSRYRTLYLASLGFYNTLSDEDFLKKKFKAALGKELNLDTPQTFNEKLQWLKLNDRNPEYIKMVDKVEAKKYVARIIGEEHIIPTLGVWSDPDDIDFKSLPNQFVLKCNHNSGIGMCICTDKSKLNLKKVRNELKKALKQDFYMHGREWPYKNVKRKVLAEKYMMDKSMTTNNGLNDYKFLCFNGKVLCSFVCTERFSSEGLKVTFFDREWNEMPFERIYPKSSILIPKPLNYNYMLELAEKISKNIPFLRVDFYEINGEVYFGELTFSPGGGFEGITPEEWDFTLGSWIDLSQVKRCEHFDC